MFFEEAFLVVVVVVDVDEAETPEVVVVDVHVVKSVDLAVGPVNVKVGSVVGLVVSEKFWGEAALVVVVVVHEDEAETLEVLVADVHVGKSLDLTVGPAILKRNLEVGKMEKIGVAGHHVDVLVFFAGLVLAEKSLKHCCLVQ